MYRDLQTRPTLKLSGLPGLRQEGYNDFVAVVDELTAFVRERDRTPLAAAPDLTESGLGSWLDG